MNETKKEREANRRLIERVVYEHHFTAAICEYTRSSREFTIDITTMHGLKAEILIWPEDAILISWHGLEAPRKLSRAFGDVNTYHFHKSTDVEYSISSLLLTLQRRFQQIHSGEAFQ